MRDVKGPARDLPGRTRCLSYSSTSFPSRPLQPLWFDFNFNVDRLTSLNGMHGGAAGKSTSFPLTPSAMKAGHGC